MYGMTIRWGSSRTAIATSASRWRPAVGYVSNVPHSLRHVGNVLHVAAAILIALFLSSGLAREARAKDTWPTIAPVIELDDESPVAVEKTDVASDTRTQLPSTFRGRPPRVKRSLSPPSELPHEKLPPVCYLPGKRTANLPTGTPNIVEMQFDSPHKVQRTRPPQYGEPCPFAPPVMVDLKSAHREVTTRDHILEIDVDDVIVATEAIVESEEPVPETVDDVVVADPIFEIGPQATFATVTELPHDTMSVRPVSVDLSLEDEPASESTATRRGHHGPIKTLSRARLDRIGIDLIPHHMANAPSTPAELPAGGAARLPQTRHAESAVTAIVIDGDSPRVIRPEPMEVHPILGLGTHIAPREGSSWSVSSAAGAQPSGDEPIIPRGMSGVRPLPANQQPPPAQPESIPPPQDPSKASDTSPAADSKAAVDLFKPLCALGTNITPPSGKMPANIATAHFAFAGFQPMGMGFSRCDVETLFNWEAPALCYQPLYFEEVNLERHGHEVRYIQPVLSGAHFFSRVPAVPYLMISQKQRICNYTLGHYRPGSYAPYVWYYPNFSLDGAAVESLLITGLFYAIP